MQSGVVDALLSVVQQYGLVVLFVIFVFEGAIVGKLLPTRTVFVGIILFVGGGLIDFLSVYVVAVAGATVGQVGLFVLLRYADVEFEALSWVPVDEHQIDRAAYWFDEWGLPAVSVSNVLPVMRGSMTLPVAMSNASVVEFTLASGVGTVVYVGVLVAIAEGLDALLF